MLSTFRRALTPNAGQAQDRDLSGLTSDSSPAVPGLLMRDPSPPPFSPLEPSEDDIPPSTGQAAKDNNPLMPAQQGLPLETFPGHNLPDRKQDDTDDSLLGPVRASNATSLPHHGSFLLDGASGDLLPPPLEGVHTPGSPLPSVETTLFTSKSHRTQPAPTPSENHTGMSSTVSSPPKSSRSVAGILQPRGSPLPSTQPVRSTSKAQPAQQSPAQSEKHAVLEPKNRNTPQPSEMTTEKSRETALRSPRSREVSTISGSSHVQPQQSVPQQSVSAKADDPHAFTSSQAPSSKRKRGEDTTETETKSVKKHRSQPRKEKVSRVAVKPQDVTQDKSSTGGGKSKKEGGHTGSVKQQGAAKDQAPKQRGRPKKEGGHAGSVKQQGAAKDQAPKQRGRPKKEEGSTGNVKQQGVFKDKVSKKRGRPEKEEGPPHSVKSQRLSKEDTPAKRGRPKKEEGPQQSVKSQRVAKEGIPAKRGRPKKETSPQTAKTQKPPKQNRAATEMPKKRGRPAKEAKSAQAVEPASIAMVDTTKKRGRPKKGNEAAQPTETQTASPANTPRKNGRAKENKDIAEATEPQGLSNAETTKKRGRSKAARQDKTAKTRTPGKRGRPKKK